jgi:hypothetical protein
MSLVSFNRPISIVLDLVDPLTVYHIVAGLRQNQSSSFILHECYIFIIHDRLTLQIREGHLCIIWFRRGGEIGIPHSTVTVYFQLSNTIIAVVSRGEGAGGTEDSDS